MASIRSYLFRTIISVTSARITSTTSIPKLRAKISLGSSKPFLPRGVTITPIKLDAISAEWIYPSIVSPQSIILYLHGGGWTLGWSNTGRRMLAYICQASRSRALVVDYRLAPENQFPAALSDCFSAYCWLLGTGVSPQKIVIAGDSAGGNLVLSTLLALRDAGEPLPAAAVCISAVTDLECTGESFNTKKDPSLTTSYVKSMIHYYIGEQNPRLPLVSPYYGNLDGFPPLLIQVGGDEILLSDAVRMADNARTAGVDVQLAIWPKMWHVWHTLVPILPEAKQAIHEIGTFIQQRLGIT
jgi:monoterpene epsilon-lactone hydrolase